MLPNGGALASLDKLQEVCSLSFWSSMHVWIRYYNNEIRSKRMLKKIAVQFLAEHVDNSMVHIYEGNQVKSITVWHKKHRALLSISISEIQQVLKNRFFFAIVKLNNQTRVDLLNLMWSLSCLFSLSATLRRYCLHEFICKAEWWGPFWFSELANWLRVLGQRWRRCEIFLSVLECWPELRAVSETPSDAVQRWSLANQATTVSAAALTWSEELLFLLQAFQSGSQ